MIAGIICEYNPMHNAHVYHIEKTREKGHDFVVCVMSGNFMQRGECASVDKWTRAKIAVQNGADIVFELPTPWACASAETFARGGVAILKAFGVDTLSFGSEIEESDKLLACVNALESQDIKSQVKTKMKTGMSYPAALSEVFSVGDLSQFQSIISNPNSTLAIEYIKQIREQNSSMKILPIKREAVDHDSEAAKENFASASLIRKMNFEGIESFVPKTSFSLVGEQVALGQAPVKLENGEKIILAKLRTMSKSELSNFISDDTGLVSRVFESAKISTTLEQLYENIKIKNYTHSRIRREIMSAFLGIDKNIAKKIPPYIKVLAVNQNGLKLIAKRKNEMELPLVTKHSEIMKLDDEVIKIYELECANTDMFAMFSEKIRPCSLEQTNSRIIIKNET